MLDRVGAAIADNQTIKSTPQKAIKKRADAYVLDEDLGLVGEWHQTYELDEDARDRLLAHGRQDAAYAVLNTSSLLDKILLLKRQLSWFSSILKWSTIIAITLLGLILWRVW
jgi:hypothetical protein